MSKSIPGSIDLLGDGKLVVCRIYNLVNQRATDAGRDPGYLTVFKATRCVHGAKIWSWLDNGIHKLSLWPIKGKCLYHVDGHLMATQTRFESTPINVQEYIRENYKWLLKSRAKYKKDGKHCLCMLAKGPNVNNLGNRQRISLGFSPIRVKD